jgi:hypothetical protein
MTFGFSWHSRQGGGLLDLVDTTPHILKDLGSGFYNMPGDGKN